MTDSLSTLEVARRLGLSVRSVQLMVDRGELAAWKTPGGHRRILLRSLEQWLAQRGLQPPASEAAAAPAKKAKAGRSAAGKGAAPAATAAKSRPAAGGTPLRILLIEDSKHFQNLIGLLVRQHLPTAELHVADDGFVGLAMAGQLNPDVLLVDLLLPGIDGATLISSLSQHPQFKGLQLVVVTSLDEAEREPFAFALRGVRVVHKPRVVAELPPLLDRMRAARAAAK